MSFEWFRWYHGTVSDPKLALVAKKAEQPRPVAIAVWAALLEQASRTEHRGDVSAFDVEITAVALNIDEDAIKAIIDAMTDKGMIADQKITKWNQRQPQREDGAAERAKAWRERKKQQPANAPNASERKRTQTNADERSERDTEKDTEKETEREAEAESRARTETENPPTARAARLLLENLPPEWATWASTERPDLDPLHTWELFRDYWTAKPGKDGLKTDWLATWRNWVRRERNTPAPSRTASIHTNNRATLDAWIGTPDTCQPSAVIEGEFRHEAKR